MVDKIVAAIGEARLYVRQTLTDDFNSRQSDWALKFFSDNLVVGYPCDEGGGISPASAARFIIRCVQRYQLRMTLNAFFLRGALTQGPVCLTDDIIFGTALLECYRLESKTSIVPRVILTEPLQQRVAESIRDSGDKASADTRNSICRDIDGWWFVSYLEAAWEGGAVNWELIDRHKHAVLESLAGVTGHDVLPKYGWACRYHNMFCHWYRQTPGYSDRFRIDRGDEASVIRRLGDPAESTG